MALESRRLDSEKALESALGYQKILGILRFVRKNRGFARCGKGAHLVVRNRSHIEACSGNATNPHLHIADFNRKA